MAISVFTNLISPIATAPGAVNVGGVYVGNPPDAYFNQVEPNDNNVSWAGTQFGVGSLNVTPIPIPHYAVVSAVNLLFSQTYSATNAGSSQAQSLSLTWGIYSLNGATLSLTTSGTYSTLCSVTGSTSSVSFNGVKGVFLPIRSDSGAALFAPGNYYVGIISSTASGGNAIAAAISNVVYSVPGGLSAYKGIFGSSTNVSNQARVGCGVFSVSSSAIPASFGLSDIVGSIGGTVSPVFNLVGTSA
jgi:hypothetical protein